MEQELPKSLYKYVTAKGLISILEGKTLKWSAPQTFNDPFDLQINPWKLNFADFKAVLREKLNTEIFEPNPPPENTNPIFVELRKRILSNSNFNDEMKRNEVERICDSITERTREDPSGVVSLIDSTLKQARVLCLTEKHNDLLMWGHYSDGHKGGVVKLKCEDGLVIGHEGALKVSYTEERPDSDFIPTLIDFFLGNIEYPPDGNKYLITKRTQWVYEKEWRLIRVASKPDEDNEYHDFPAEELEAVYLGCKIQQGNKIKILDLLNKNEFGHVQVFQASKNSNMSELDFNPI